MNPRIFLNNDFENKNLGKEIRASPSSSISPASPDEEFKNRALSFLKGINTGSVSMPNKLVPEALQFVTNDLDLPPVCIRNSEESVELLKVQVWVTQGIIKKSYQHCLQSIENVPCPDRPWINFNEYPGKVIPSPIKDQMNIEFREQHSYLDPKLTLSKIVNLREDLIVLLQKVTNFDPVTLAIGLTCFDRLLNMNLVNKINRKLYAAVCILLSFKFIEETHLDEVKSMKEKMLNFFYQMDKHDLLTTQMILESEFRVYSYLNFSMHLAMGEIKSNLDFIKLRALVF